jgi:hypothetical protein
LKDLSVSSTPYALFYYETFYSSPSFSSSLLPYINVASLPFSMLVFFVVIVDLSPALFVVLSALGLVEPGASLDCSSPRLF